MSMMTIYVKQCILYNYMSAPVRACTSVIDLAFSSGSTYPIICWLCSLTTAATRTPLSQSYQQHDVSKLLSVYPGDHTEKIA